MLPRLTLAYIITQVVAKRKWHTAHLHGEQTKERMGVKIRTLSPLCGTDEYHADHLFVDKFLTAEAFVWDVGEGWVGSANYTPTEEELREMGV